MPSTGALGTQSYFVSKIDLRSGGLVPQKPAPAPAAASDREHSIVRHWAPKGRGIGYAYACGYGYATAKW